MALLTPAEKDELAESYPNLRRWLDVPGLEDFFEHLQRDELLSDLEIGEAFKASPWFRTHAAANREWSGLLLTDPATAAKDLEFTVSDLERRATGAGITLSGAELDSMADQILRWGLVEADITAMLGTHVTADVGTTGSIAEMARKFQSEARGFFTVLSDAQALDYAKAVFAEGLTYEGVVNQFRTDAREFYPQFGDALDRNLNIVQATNGLRSHVAGMMNTTAEDIDLTDQRFSHLIDYTDPDTGERRMKNKTEIDHWARQQEEFRSGQQGMAEGANLTMNFLRAMGKKA